MMKTRKKENPTHTSRSSSSSSLQTHSMGISKTANEPPKQKGHRDVRKESHKYRMKDEAQKGQKNGKKGQESL